MSYGQPWRCGRGQGRGATTPSPGTLRTGGRPLVGTPYARVAAALPDRGGSSGPAGVGEMVRRGRPERGNPKKRLPEAVLVHFRLTVPAALITGCARARGPRPHHQRRPPGGLPGAGGDLIECDVAREKTGAVLEELHQLGAGERGGIVVTTPTELRSPKPSGSRRWLPVTPRTRDLGVGRGAGRGGAEPTVSYHVFLVLAVILAAIAVITDSAVLVVGAMVVGPEFAAVAAAAPGSCWAGGAWSGAACGCSYSLHVRDRGGHPAGAARPCERAGHHRDVTRPRPEDRVHLAPRRVVVHRRPGRGRRRCPGAGDRETATMVGVFICVTTVPAAATSRSGSPSGTHEIAGRSRSSGSTSSGW